LETTGVFFGPFAVSDTISMPPHYFRDFFDPEINSLSKNQTPDCKSN